MQISYGASCDCLSDKTRYPSFLRTYHNDIHLGTAFAHFVRSFSWTYVGILGVEDEYVRNTMAMFLAGVEPHGICIAFKEILPQHYNYLNLQTLGEEKKNF